MHSELHRVLLALLSHVTTTHISLASYRPINLQHECNVQVIRPHCSKIQLYCTWRKNRDIRSMQITLHAINQIGRKIRWRKVVSIHFLQKTRHYTVQTVDACTCICGERQRGREVPRPVRLLNLQECSSV